MNPTNDTVIGKVTMADEIDTRKAIAAAKEAFNTFSQSSKEYRMDCLQRLHDAVAKRMDQLVDATVWNTALRKTVRRAPTTSRRTFSCTSKKFSRTSTWSRTVGTSKVVMEPAGVVGIFTPWNSSAGSIAIKVAPAIAAGCTVVIKPSEMSAMQTEVLMDAFHEAGLPPGVINFVTGLGEVVGTELTKSPDIQKIAFTGSTQIGKLVAKNSLDTMKRLTLELGGKSPNIILDDADFSTAIPMAVSACYLNNGQACIAASRLIVPEDRLDEVKRLAKSGRRTNQDGRSEEQGCDSRPIGQHKAV